MEPIDVLGLIPVPAVALSDGRIIAANDRAYELLATDAAVGRRLQDFVHVDDHTALGDALAGRLDEREPRGIRINGTPDCFVDVNVQPGETFDVVVLTDATERVRCWWLLRESAAMISVIGPQGEPLWGPIGRNVSLERKLGNVHAGDRIHPEDMADALTAWTHVREEPDRRATIEIRSRVLDDLNSWQFARHTIANLAHLPEVGGVVLYTHEVDQEMTVSSLGRTSGAYLSVADAAPVGIVLTGPAGFPTYFNEAMMKLLPGCGIGEENERDWISFARESDRDSLRGLVDKVIHDRQPENTVACFEPDGATTWFLVTVAPREVEDDRLVGLVVTVQDVTAEIEVRQQLEAAQERLLHLATHDPLTGLANRTLLTEELRSAGVRVPPTDEPTAILFCDLDGFKLINDTYGHDVGDRILVEVADRLESHTRSGDLVSRLGGDEFVVLLPGIDAATLERIRADIDEQLHLPFAIDDGRLHVGVSIGVAWLEQGDSATAALRRADHSMYAAKQSRRDD